MSSPNDQEPHKILNELSESADTEVVFSEPWEAQAFAMAVTLSGNGYFTWKEWAVTLRLLISETENYFLISLIGFCEKDLCRDR